jgi:MFS family permease
MSLSVMRAIQGFCASPLETLVSATVSEIFFVHEKGRMLSIWNLFVMGGVKLGYDHYPTASTMHRTNKSLARSSQALSFRPSASNIPSVFALSCTR